MFLFIEFRFQVLDCLFFSINLMLIFFMGFTQVHILLQFFLFHFIEMFVFSLNFLNSLLKFVIVLLNSVS